jgi:transposase
MLKTDYYTPPSALDLIVFEKLVPPDHYLRRVKELIHFDPVREMVAGCYSPTMGRPADDPVMMLKLSFLQFQYDLSDREVIEQAKVNIAFRFFLDLGLESQLPVPSLLTQFRARLGAEMFRQVFEEILRQIRAHGLVKDRLRLKDATHVIANIAVPRTIELVAQTRGQLLEAARPLAADEVAAHEARAEEVRQATADLKDDQRLLQRVEHLRQIVAWADSKQEQLTNDAEPKLDPEQRAEFNRALELAHKVLADRDPQAADKLVSLVDPDARVGKHGGYYTGYALDVSLDADSEIICSLDVLAANGDEAANAQALVESEEAAQGNDVESLSIDSIGFRGDVLRALTEEGGPQVEVYVPPYSHESNHPELYQPSDFQLDEAKAELTCPGGQKTRTRYRASHNQGWQFNFKKEQCAHCPLRDKCLKPANKSGRTVVKNDYEAEYAAARERAQTPAYQEVRNQHPRIERKLAEMIRWHGGRRVRYRTRARVKIQYFLTAVVVNFKRLVKLFHQPLAVQPT